MRKIDNFKGEYYFLSNFYPAHTEYEGLKYLNSEAAFQAAKCKDENIRILFTKLPPNQAKSKGRKVELRDNWDDIRDEVMYDIVYNKFLQNEDLKEKLLNTGGIYLEEGNWWHDNYWGQCNCYRCRNIHGLNKLGKILMQVRDELRGE